MSDGLWAPSRRALTAGLVLTITFVAAEALAVITVMPLVARDLHDLGLYGFVFSAFMLGTVVGIVAAGRAADRSGPAVPYIAGLVLFCAGLAVGGLAPSMPVLVAGRALQGLGAGAIPSVAYAAIGRSLPTRLQARMMAMLSTAWVAPGLVGPAISAEIARLFGWRWVFLGLLPLIAITGPVAIPALARLGRPAASAADGHRLIDGVGTALAAGAFLAGLTLVTGSGGTPGGGRASGVATATLGAVLVVAGGIAGLRVLRRLLPAGTFAARRGLPATILGRGLLTFTFFGADAFVTLTITILRHRSPVVAGFAVTGATLAWTTGAWIQARMNERWEGRRLFRVGVSIILVGIAGLVVLLRPDVPVAEGIIAWTVGGLGMGICYAPLTLMMLKEAPPGREGWAAASINLADVLGSALGIGIGGAAISAVVHIGWPLAVGVGAAFAITAMAGVTAIIVSRRLPARAGSVAGASEVPPTRRVRHGTPAESAIPTGQVAADRT
jgi:MFS family permease